MEDRTELCCAMLPLKPPQTPSNPTSNPLQTIGRGPSSTALGLCWFCPWRRMRAEEDRGWRTAEPPAVCVTLAPLPHPESPKHAKFIPKLFGTRPEVAADLWELLGLRLAARGRGRGEEHPL